MTQFIMGYLKCLILVNIFTKRYLRYTLTVGDENMGKIKINLVDLIKQSGMSKNKFSYRADMSKSQVNAYCNNTIRRLDVDVLARICNTLGCRLSDLLEYMPED